jgi:hypothetical protein
MRLPEVATALSASTRVPVCTATAPKLPVCLIVARPSAGAVQENQTLEPPWVVGSPGSTVAPSVLPVDGSAPATIGSAASNMSFGGGGVSRSENRNSAIWASWPSIAIL